MKKELPEIVVTGYLVNEKYWFDIELISGCRPENYGKCFDSGVEDTIKCLNIIKCLDLAEIEKTRKEEKVQSKELDLLKEELIQLYKSLKENLGKAEEPNISAKIYVIEKDIQVILRKEEDALAHFEDTAEEEGREVPVKKDEKYVKPWVGPFGRIDPNKKDLPDLKGFTVEDDLFELNFDLGNRKNDEGLEGNTVKGFSYDESSKFSKMSTELLDCKEECRTLCKSQQTPEFCIRNCFEKMCIISSDSSTEYLSLVLSGLIIFIVLLVIFLFATNKKIRLE